MLIATRPYEMSTLVLIRCSAVGSVQWTGEGPEQIVSLLIVRSHNSGSKIGSAELSVMDHPLSISSARFKRNEDAAVKFLRFVFGKCIAGIRSWIGQKRPARSKKRMLEVFRFVDRSRG